MDYLFRVTIPIEAIVAESLDSTSVTWLPSGPVTLGDLTLTGDPERDGYYEVAAEVVADRPGAAKRSAIGLVENLLYVLALNWDAFEIRVSGIESKSLGAATPTPAPIRTSDGIQVDLPRATMFLGGRLGVAKTKHDLDKEQAALLSQADWPPHLRRALELNYLAARHHDWSIRFLLLAIALDVLVGKSLGSPPGLLKSRLGKCRRRLLERLIERALKRFGLTEADRGRLIDHLRHTHAYPMTDHLGQYLRGQGIEREPEVIREWWRTRGKLAHGEEIDHDTLRRRAEDLRQAVCGALKEEVGGA